MKKPKDTIHEIYIFSEEPIEYSEAELHWYKELKDLNDNWHFPTEKESEILFELYKIPKLNGDGSLWIPNNFYSLFFGSVTSWFIGDGEKYYFAKNYYLVTDKKARISKSFGCRRSVIFVR